MSVRVRAAEARSVGRYEIMSRRWSLAVGLLLSGFALAGAAADLYALSAFFRVLRAAQPAPLDLLPWKSFPSLAGLCTIVPPLLAASVPLVWFGGERARWRHIVTFIYSIAVLLMLWYEFAFIRSTAWHVMCRECSGPAL